MLVLQNERLKVEVAESGELYTAPRFDWAGIVKQVTLDGMHTFLSEERASMTAAKNGGIGITGSFEPAPAPFLQNVHYQAEQISDTEVIFTGKTQTLCCTKKLTVRDTCLEMTHTVQNLGKEQVSFGEYNHNFMLIDGMPYGPDYQVHFSFPPQLTGRKEGYYNRLKLEGQTMVTQEAFGEPPEDALTQIEGFAGMSLPYTWELFHVPTGLYVRETDDFPIWKYQFWCRKDNICSEIFTKQWLNPAGERGDTAEWKRIYTFGKKQEDAGHETV